MDSMNGGGAYIPMLRIQAECLQRVLQFRRDRLRAIACLSFLIEIYRTCGDAS